MADLEEEMAETCGDDKTHFVRDVVVVVAAVVDGRLLSEPEEGEVGRLARGSQTRHLVAV